MIKTLVVLNGGSYNNDYFFHVGEQSPIGLGKVKKILINARKEDAYIVFLDDGSEIDVISDKIMVHTKY